MTFNPRNQIHKVLEVITNNQSRNCLIDETRMFEICKNLMKQCEKVNDLVIIVMKSACKV